jgi:hypothetical protein
MAAWYDLQANPERITTQGNAALVQPGAAEIELGGDVSVGLASSALTFLTPARVKIGLAPRLQVHMVTEGFLVRSDVQRPAGLGAGFKVALFEDPDGRWPEVAGRFDAWGPFPARADNQARVQAELICGRTVGPWAYALSAGGDFVAAGASSPMGGVAFGIPEFGPISLMAEARYSAGRFYGGISSGWTINRQSVVDLGAGFRSDGSVALRAGFTRAFALWQQ